MILANVMTRELETIREVLGKPPIMIGERKFRWGYQHSRGIQKSVSLGFVSIFLLYVNSQDAWYYYYYDGIF